MEERKQPAENSLAGNTLNRLALARPILISIVLFLIALFFRWIDGFVLRLDERVGELILTKALGFLLVLAFLWATRRRLKDIGLHSSRLGPSLLVGVLTTAVAFALGYSVEILIALQQGTQPALQFGAIDSKLGVTGGALFALWLIGVNFINSFMEEGLFRGVMIPLFKIKLSFWQTNWLQALFFGAWHLPWVVKYYQLGEIQTGGEIALSILNHSLPQIVVGLVWGYFFLKTNSLWTPWIAHVLANSTSNLLHVRTTEGLDSNFMIRMGVFMIVMLLSMLVVHRVAKRTGLPEVRAWE
jgi:membrane protease YdiL (CAAX protease family)